MAWRLGQVLAAGAIKIGALAIRAAGAAADRSQVVRNTLSERFAGIYDSTLGAMYDRIIAASLAGRSYGSAIGNAGFPEIQPVDIRPELRREFGAPPPDPTTGTNIEYTYVADVTTNQPDATGGGNMSFPISITSPELLAGDALAELAAEGVSAFIQMLIDEYGRDNLEPQAHVNDVNILVAYKGYKFPPGWTL